MLLQKLFYNIVDNNGKKEKKNRATKWCQMAFLTHDVLANLTHITIYSPTISLNTAHSNRENWTRYYLAPPIHFK